MSLSSFAKGKGGTRHLNALVDALNAALALLAPLASPTFSGTLTAADTVITGKRKFAPTAVATAIATAGNDTLTAAALNGGVITRDCNGADRTDATDTAANIIATLGLTANFQSRECLVVNNGAANTLTLGAGAGVTLASAITVPVGAARRLFITRTGAAAVSVAAA